MSIVPGAVVEGNPNYVPNKPVVTLTIDNNVIWKNNDDTAHTVTPDHRHMKIVTVVTLVHPGVLKPGEIYEFLFTEPQDVPYHCTPHPWMDWNNLCKSK